MERDVILRLRLLRRPGTLGTVATEIGRCGALIGEIHSLRIGKDFNIREITVAASSDAMLSEVVSRLRAKPGVEIVYVGDRALRRHEGGKLRVTSRVPVETLADLRDIYTPGVARVCLAIKEEPALARRYTAAGGLVAIVTNGTRVLGLGDIGPLAALPVMEGKAVLYERFAGISAIPILFRSKDPETIVRCVEEIAVGFAAIHLEDIRVPDCFRIERELEERLDIPVMHDDQHGTAVVALAAARNACRSAGTDLRECTAGVLGLGAAGSAIAGLLKAYGVKKVLGFDRDPAARAMLVDRGGEPADSLEALVAASELLVTVTGVAGLLEKVPLRRGSVLLALSNPVPEITADEAIAAGARFAADGSSVNNALSYPGIFRGAIAVRARRIDGAMKIAAAEAIADSTEEGEIVPSPFDPAVHLRVARAVARAAVGSGIAAEVEPDVDARIPPLER